MSMFRANSELNESEKKLTEAGQQLISAMNKVISTSQGSVSFSEISSETNDLLVKAMKKIPPIEAAFYKCLSDHENIRTKNLQEKSGAFSETLSAVAKKSKELGVTVRKSEMSGVLEGTRKSAELIGARINSTCEVYLEQKKLEYKPPSQKI